MRRNTFDRTGAGNAASGSRWRAVPEMIRKAGDTLALWHMRARSRREIEELDDRLLRDAGVDRSEANKPFWRE